jgi:hypothetical protein
VGVNDGNAFEGMIVRDLIRHYVKVCLTCNVRRMRNLAPLPFPLLYCRQN